MTNWSTLRLAISVFPSSNYITVLKSECSFISVALLEFMNNKNFTTLIISKRRKIIELTSSL